MIRVEGLQKRFNSRIVLADVSLAVEPGETRVVIGQSGEGKSVLLKHLIALMRPDAGLVEIAGVRLEWGNGDSLRHVRRNVGMLFQGAALFDSMNVRDNVAFGLVEQRRLTRAEIDRVVDEKLAMVNLSGIHNTMPSELSGGMRKRVGLARALATDPKIMLYDEPTTGLDPINADAINDLIIGMKRRLGVTSVVVTHDMASALKVADRVSMLHEGRIVETADRDAIRDSANPFVKEFLGKSGAGD